MSQDEQAIARADDQPDVSALLRRMVADVPDKTKRKALELMLYFAHMPSSANACEQTMSLHLAMFLHEKDPTIGELQRTVRHLLRTCGYRPTMKDWHDTLRDIRKHDRDIALAERQTRVADEVAALPAPEVDHEAVKRKIAEVRAKMMVTRPNSRADDADGGAR